MLGIDLTKISRFKDPTDAFLKRVLHPKEMEEYDSAEDKSRFLAKRWAIKEALFKADNNLSSFNKIELETQGRTLKYEGYEISTTTEDDYYIAIVMKEN